MIIGNPITLGTSGGGGGEATLIDKSVAANGTYYAVNDSADGYKKVTVNVPGATIVSKTITANGTYNAEDDDATGYGSVIVNVVAPAGRCPRADQTTAYALDTLMGFYAMQTTAAAAE